MDLLCHKPRNPWGYQKLEEARKDPPLEGSEGVWPCQHLDFVLLASTTVSEFMSVVLSQEGRKEGRERGREGGRKVLLLSSL